MGGFPESGNEKIKVVVSPDKMRAWVMLEKPEKGEPHTEAAIESLLPQSGVVYGASPELIAHAVACGVYGELLEVARGKAPIEAVGADYRLVVEKKPFTGLPAAGDGSLIYDDLSFLLEVPAGEVLAEVISPVEAESGMTVTGEVLEPREGTPGRTLKGTGFVVTDEGRLYRTPTLSHVSVVNDQLVVKPLSIIKGLTEEDGEHAFEGNVVVEGDVTRGAKFSATGSVFVKGRCASCTIKAGNNLLLCGGMRASGEPGSLEASENVWGQFFEYCKIKSGGEVCANHMSGCDVVAGGRVSVLGGKASIESCDIQAATGVVAGSIGSPNASETIIRCGLGQDILDRHQGVAQKIDKLNIDIQSLQQNITAYERVNKMKPDKGRQDTAYKDMVKRRDQNLSVLSILNNERTRLKRIIDQASAVNVIAKSVAYSGVVIIIDTRRMDVKTELQHAKFRRRGEVIEVMEVRGK